VSLQSNRFAIRTKNGPGKGARANEQSESGTDYASKLLHLAWHPEANVVAAAASNSLYMYCSG
jgi:serine/threonine-protein phosphatase 2A regulatory subunit B